jgi:hypothetical protein
LKKVKIKEVKVKERNNSAGKKKNLIKSYSVLSKFTTEARKSINEKFTSVKLQQILSLS